MVDGDVRLVSLASMDEDELWSEINRHRLRSKEVQHTNTVYMI